jgi:hypothetical protein
MANYIVCNKKRNAPRLNVRFCHEKCPLKSDCKEYLTYLKLPLDPKQMSVSTERSSTSPSLS